MANPLSSEDKKQYCHIIDGVGVEDAGFRENADGVVSPMPLVAAGSLFACTGDYGSRSEMCSVKKDPCHFFRRLYYHLVVKPFYKCRRRIESDQNCHGSMFNTMGFMGAWYEFSAEDQNRLRRVMLAGGDLSCLEPKPLRSGLAQDAIFVSKLACSDAELISALIGTEYVSTVDPTYDGYGNFRPDTDHFALVTDVYYHSPKYSITCVSYPDKKYMYRLCRRTTYSFLGDQLMPYGYNALVITARRMSHVPVTEQGSTCLARYVITDVKISRDDDAVFIDPYEVTTEERSTAHMDVDTEAGLVTFELRKERVPTNTTTIATS